MLCLPQENAAAFKKALKEGELKIPELIKMSTEDRTAAFGKVVGNEYAQAVNTMFEQKLLLKNQQAGLIDWIKTVGGLKKEARTDLIARIQKMDRVFSPAEEQSFLNDVADKTLGTDISREEAQNIFDLAKKVEEAKNYDGVNDIESLVTSFEKLDQNSLTPAQREAIKDLRAKLEAEKAEKEEARMFLESERQAAKDRIAAERKAIREKADAERARIREEKMEKAQQEREDARIQREVEAQEARLERQLQQEQERFDRQAERDAERSQKKALQEATGESLKKLKKIFTDITNQKFKNINQFSKDMQDQLNDLVDKREAIKNGEDRMIYGRAKVALDNYVSEITRKTTGEEFKEAPLRFIGGVSKGLKATLDNSALLRQGIQTLYADPTKWAPNALKSFVDIYNTIGGKAVNDEIRADIVSRENYINGKYKKMGLAVNTREELHPSALPERIPYVGRIFEASENAFGGFLHRTRADLADMYLKRYEDAGVELTDNELASFGKLINSQTGRGYLGSFEGAADTLNNFFFSIRSLKATVDTLSLHAFDSNFSPKARKAAAVKLVKVMAAIATIAVAANAIHPGSFEWDPRSSDFGKIKIGDTRFDITGGMSSMVVLISRLLTQSTKNSSTGEVTPLNGSQFGAKTGKDVLVDFFENKLSPLAAAAEHLFITHKGQDGKPTNIFKETAGLFAPLPFTNAAELLQDPNSAPFLAGIIGDGLGLSSNTYAGTKKQQHETQITDMVKKNYEAKQAGQDTKSAREIAKEVYGDGFDTTQENAIQKEMDFYRAFGEDNKTANDIKDAQQASDVIDILDKAHEEMSKDDFRKFYNKALDSKLISSAMDKKWQTFLETGKNDSSDTNLDGSKADRKLIDIIVTAGQAIGASPLEAFKLILKNQSIRRVDNGQIIINRNTNFFDKQVGKNGYSDEIRKEWDASKEQNLDHTIPVEGGGLDDTSNLALISNAEWKKNSQVENYLGEALRSKKITGDQLREYAIRYKAGRGQNISPELMKEYQKKYAGVPLTFDEIKALVK